MSTVTPLQSAAVEANSAGAPGSRGVKFIDPQTLMRIKNLQMRAKVLVDGFYSGIHRSPYHGFSVEFSEYRQYSPGDDLRYLDWRLFGRSDRYYIKRYEDETNLLCHILVDTSSSMGYGSAGYTKCDYARTMAATMAYFLYLQRDAVGMITFDEAITDYLPPRHRPGHLRHIMAMLQREPAGKETDLATPLEQISQTVRKRGMVVLISDLLAPSGVLRTQLGYLRSRGHDVVVFRVLDPAEIDFSFSQPGMFLDVESGRRVYIDPEVARAQYLERFEAHAAELQKACRDMSAELITCPTDRPLELALYDLLRLRMQRGRRPARNEGPGRKTA